MNLNLLKKSSIVEKEEAFMPLVFVDIPAAAIALNGSGIGYTLNRKFNKKDILLPSFQHNKLAKLPLATQKNQLKIRFLRQSIDDIEI